MTAGDYTRYTLRLPQAGSAGRQEGLEYAHPEATATIASLQPAGWQEDDGGDVLVFWLPRGSEREPATAAALRRLGELGVLEVARERTGWEEEWRRFHRPQAIGRLYVRPPWYPARDGLLDIVVEAGMAFGTGGHASTRQCLEELQNLTPGALLDLGCGSGVLSLAALRLGFAPVWGIDVDPVAVHAAAGNAALNELSPTFLVGDATDESYPLPAADIVVANIAFAPILRLAARCAPPVGGGAGALRPERLLLAGLLVGQAADVLAAYPGYRLAASRDDGTWLLLHLVRSV